MISVEYGSDIHAEAPMTTTQLRREIKKRVDRLSPDRLPVAADFLAYLQERQCNHATEELLGIPGLVGDLRKAERDLAAGRGTPLRKLRRKHGAA
jgi:hypothetical protein